MAEVKDVSDNSNEYADEEPVGMLLEYAVTVCGFGENEFMGEFAKTAAAKDFEAGRHSEVALEKISYHLFDFGLPCADPRDLEGLGRSDAYEYGVALAAFQKDSGHSFQRIVERFAPESLKAAGLTSGLVSRAELVAGMGELYSSYLPTRLGTLRAAAGLTQAQLAERSEVGLRSIQMYEQRRKDINKAQAVTVYSLAQVLGCDMSDLLEL